MLLPGGRRSLAWSDLQPRLPWLVDALLCMVMDCAIMAQFVMYRGRGGGRGEGRKQRAGGAGLVDVEQPLLPGGGDG
jgi:hypothetical protein